jgi:hypothetical protein
MENFFRTAWSSADKLDKWFALFSILTLVFALLSPAFGTIAYKISQRRDFLRNRSANDERAHNLADEAARKLEVVHLNQKVAHTSALAESSVSKLALSAAPIYTIPVIDGIATPDLSRGLTQRVVLHSDIVIAAPRLPQTSKDETIVWTLFVDQDAPGNHKYTTEFLKEKTTWPGLIGNASSSFELITDSSGHTRVRGMPIGNMLTTEAPLKK